MNDLQARYSENDFRKRSFIYLNISKLSLLLKKTSGEFNINYGLVFGFIGTAVAIASLYYRREEYKRETLKPVVINRVEQEKEPKHGTIKPTKKQPEIILDSLE